MDSVRQRADTPEQQGEQTADPAAIVTTPSISLPKGGGAIRGIGEKFAANPVTGTGSMSVPIATSPGRSGFGPQLSLTYDSGTGNGPFGFGWSLGLAQISRRTDRGLPQYLDEEQSDVFLLSGAEDLVPVLTASGTPADDTTTSPGHTIRRYRPRIEGLFARIERWRRDSDGDVHWRVLSRDNVLSVYGKDLRSRIADPGDPSRVFTWLICESRDDRGNAVVYEYKPGDGTGADLGAAHERNRGERADARRTPNRYLKHVRYGNRLPLLDGRTQPLTDAQIAAAGWLFEVVFDYGEHDALAPKPSDTGAWRHRADAFSSYRAGFEVRTDRVCRRVLMFHHFEHEEAVGVDCLVRSTDLHYTDEASPADPRNAIYTFLRGVTQAGYRRRGAGYLRSSLPTVEFEYTRPVVQDTVEEIDAESLQNLPTGLGSGQYQWTDLHGEGIPGILTEQANAWYYKRNVSPVSTRPVEFAAMEFVASRPNLALTGQRSRFMDLGGDGRQDLVVLDGAQSGFYAHDADEGWEPYRAFTASPIRDLHDPNVQLIDVDGDGLADLLISEDDAFVWHPSLGQHGFGPPRQHRKPTDEEEGPRLVFADGAHAIYFADMSGDGLTDLVRVRNGEVCYWPNLGYGHFGAKVTMDQSPWFDQPDQFDDKRVRLADIDGSGTTDLIYLHVDGVRLYFNQSGNGWSAPHRLDIFPQAAEVVAIGTVDLFGNGTACLTWSSSLPGDAQRRVRYVNLMGASKPHLLVGCVNNLGAETRIEYTPSTTFYLRDKYTGRPWLTKLPFPVHVVERVETSDTVSGSRFVTRYAYHHGYFDGAEREFRGFAMVEQWDTEEYATLTADGALPAAGIDLASHVPPTLTKSWFHTGMYAGGERVSNCFAGLLDGTDTGEYYREPLLTDAQAQAGLLADTILPTGLTVAEEVQACRALKGTLLRQEIYGLDGTALAGVPYAVTEQNVTVRCLQRQGDAPHAVFLVHPREALSRHYERQPADARTGHAMTLEVDEFGNVLRSASIAYGRRVADPQLSTVDQDRQRVTFVTLAENQFTNAVDAAYAHRTPLACQTRSYELTGLVLPAGQDRFTLADLLGADATAGVLDFAAVATGGVQKRLISATRSVFRRDDLTGELAFGTVEPLALPFESYRMVLTAKLLADVFGGRVTAALAEAEGGYAHPGADPNYWARSGRTFYSPGSADSAAQELAHARQHFFLGFRFRDPFHTAAVSTESTVGYDAYDLLLVEAQDAVGNRVTAGNDYRVLAPTLMTDANGNRAAVAFDALGLVAGTAVMGKVLPAAVEGDSLDGFDADLTEPVVLADLADPLANPAAILGRATTRLVYDVLAYQRTKASGQPQPAVVHTLSRETHDSDPVPVTGLRIRHVLAYSDGFGREFQKKVQAEPGPVPVRDGAGRIVTGADGRPVMSAAPAARRWVGSGWTVFNNKGKPVRQFEPFFTDTHRLDLDVRIGVSPVNCYDPLSRVAATLQPDHTWGKTVVSPWRQQAWDANDTVLIADASTDADVGGFFARLPAQDYLPTWYAQRQGGALGPQEQAAAEGAAVHAQTATVSHADALGRTFLTVTHNRSQNRLSGVAGPVVEALHRARTVFDIAGNQREVLDAEDRSVARYDYDMAGARIAQASMEAGRRWMFHDVAGNPLYAWDDRDHRFRHTYDPLRRPTGTFLRDGAAAEVLIGRVRYGEGMPGAAAANLHGKTVEVYDQAGVVVTDRYDFKGNPLDSTRRLTENYRDLHDWSGPVALAAQSYATGTRYDALNRPTEQRTPDGSVLRPRFNEAGLLDRVDANLRGAAAPTPFVVNIDYDSRGQRTAIEYGNGTRTGYTYHPLTFRLIGLLTTRGAGGFPDDCPSPAPAGWPGCQVQNLHYTHDPVGNVTYIRDDSQQTRFFRNRRVEPNNAYNYDALYRLVEATGREHLGQVGAAPTPGSYNDAPRVGIQLAASDGTAVGRYLETFTYDRVGNPLTVAHLGSDPVAPGWTRTYAYTETSALDPGTHSNRLTSTTVGASTETYSTAGDGYDPHGNMQRMAHLHLMQWDFKDQLRMTQRQAVNAVDADGLLRNGERTWYVYDMAGQRVRKVTEFAAGQLKEERVYLGGFEVYHRYGVDPLTRETLHVMADKRRIALVETRTEGTEQGTPAQLIRYQLDNHLGSASLELDQRSQIISYEEYTPYGCTSYQAVRGQTETAKRYRFTGKERDDESGLSYHGARYYCPWLGRWTSCDPAGLADGANVYLYAHANPISYVDPSGTENVPILMPNGQPTSLVWLGKDDDSAAGGVPKASLSGPSSIAKAAPPKTPAAAKPAAPARAPRGPATSTLTDAESMHNLKAIAEQLQVKLTYPKELTHALGVVQMIGGGLEIAAAIATTETGVGPVLLGAHGLDTLQTGARTAWTGEQQHTVVFYAGSGATFLVSNDAKLASAVGSTWDMAGNMAAGGYALKLTPPTMITMPPGAGESGLVTQTLEQASFLKAGGAHPEAAIVKGNQVLAGVEDTMTGQRFFGRSAEDVAENLHPALQQEHGPWSALIEGDKDYARLGPPGAHGEINALNRALWARDPTGTALTAADFGSFDMTAVWLGKNGPYVMPRCPTCWYMTPNINYLGPIGPRP